MDSEEKNDFQRLHDGLRRLRRRGFVAHRGGQLINKPKPGEIKGKKNIRAAKRERVREMKAAKPVEIAVRESAESVKV